MTESIRPSEVTTLVVGAGPAGLSTAEALAMAGHPVTVLELDPIYVGGIARTQEYKGYLFDIGGHRLFSKNAEVMSFWRRLLGSDLLERPRSSQIYYGRKFYSYPLKPFEALVKVGFVEAIRCVVSYLKASWTARREPRSFEDWAVQHFGRRLFEIFFKTYTEKVWGMACEDISADWASQRIRGLSLYKAIADSFLPSFLKKRGSIKSLTDRFWYPRRGPGMLWDRCAESVRRHGGVVEMGRRVTRARFLEDVQKWEVSHRGAAGDELVVLCTNLVTSAPLRDVLRQLEPAPPVPILAAADGLKYRAFLTVVLMCRGESAFSDQWIYIHEPDVKVGRIQNFKSWSPEMVPDPDVWTYGLEYFCNENDPLWSSTDEALIELAKEEISKIGIVSKDAVFDGCVVRQAKAYPVYDAGYESRVQSVRHWLAAERPTLCPVGRNGMHRYNNQDHAMVTGLLVARNILAGTSVWDPWQVNQDAEYHEETREPRKVTRPSLSDSPA